jgi:hypothetical protein
MTVGTLTLACVLLATGQVPDDVAAFNQVRVRLPIEIQPARRQEISQITLYVSADKGQTWNQEAVALPDKTEFTFNAPADGEYWFRVATKDLRGRQEPENIYQGPPAQKILIDTLKPLVRIVSARREGEDVAVAWEIQEDHPDLKSERLEYHTPDMPEGTWEQAMLTQSLSGQTRVRIPGQKAARIRLQMKDTAGNLSLAEATVAAGSGITTAGFTPEGTGPAPVRPASQTMPAPAEALKPGPGAVPVPTPPAPQADRVPLPGPAAGQAVLPPAPRPEQAPADAGAVPVASSDAPPLGQSGALPSTAFANRPLPAAQIVNSTELTMKYRLDRVGPSGVGKVELWLTTDDGRSWQRWAEDPEAAASLHGGEYQRRVELPKEGVYGFRLVVQSPVGLGDAPPQPGDPPEMRVEVDMTAPKAQLYCMPDPDHDNALLLRWECEDKNLAGMPVILEWAEQREGPWQRIAPPLAARPNLYSWALPPGTPVYVYLRLRVRDTAGNEGVAVTPRPQLADLSKPTGRLLAISPTTRH